MAQRRLVRVEEGAVLVLALVFMIVIALVLMAVVTLAGNGLASTSQLLNQQSLEYRSSGALQVAIETVRYTNTTYNSLASCFSGSGGVTVGSGGSSTPPVYVDCVSVPLNQLPANTGVSREITFYACSTSSTSCKSTNYTVTATVDFVDGPSCATGSIGSCGTGESVKTWLVHNANI